ncbi:MAG: tetratricopeptide repeat protein [Pseudomonadota bacterium]
MKIGTMLLAAALLFALEVVAAPDLSQLRRQAGQGDAWAQLNLGAAYDNGMGVERDVDRALHWYQKAAEQGLAKAQFNLAHLLVSEEISPVAAAEWMLKAAKQGMADAQFLMGVIYAEGIGVAADDAKAVHWLERAEAQGQDDAAAFLRERYSGR